MTPEAKLLKKHERLWEGQSVALDPAPEDAGLFDALLFTNAHELALAGRGSTATREILAGETTSYDAAVLYLPKSKRRQAFMMACAASLAPKVVVVGSKREGIKSARKALAELGTIEATESGAHRRMLVARTRPCSLDLDAWEERFEHEGLTLVGLPGVFSRGRVDAGTRLLLQALEVRGRVLDVGCGSGILGATLARRGCEVTLSDVDALAVEAARRTLAANDLEGDCIHTDRYAGIEGRFDAIVTNPPFHEGVATEYDTTAQLIREAPSKLREGGTMWLVYNRFLPWHDALTATFDEVERLVDDGRYCVARAR